MELSCIPERNLRTFFESNIWNGFIIQPLLSSSSPRQASLGWSAPKVRRNVCSDEYFFNGPRKICLFLFWFQTLFFSGTQTTARRYSITKWPVDSSEKRLLSSPLPPFVHTGFRIYGTLAQYSKWPKFYLHFYIVQHQHSSFYHISTKEKLWVTSFSVFALALPLSLGPFKNI